MITLQNLIPTPIWSDKYVCDLRFKMAKAAIKEAVHDALATWLISMTGLGESLREESEIEVEALFGPIKELWHKEAKKIMGLSVGEWYAEKDAFLTNDPSRIFIRTAVEVLSEALAKAWIKKQD
jgi:hypothetical protein